MDQRVEKSKTKLKAALVQCLETSNLEDITVSQLCKTAQVNRSTFYVHYGNVNECFEEIMQEILEEMRGKMRFMHADGFEPYMNIYFDTARENRAVFLAIHRTNIFHPLIRGLTELYSGALSLDINVPKGTENLLTNYMLSGFFGMVHAWLLNGCQEDNEALNTVIRKAAGRE